MVTLAYTNCKGSILRHEGGFQLQPFVATLDLFGMVCGEKLATCIGYTLFSLKSPRDHVYQKNVFPQIGVDFR